MFLTPHVSSSRPRSPALWPDLNREFDWLFQGLSSPAPSAALSSWDVKEEKDRWIFTIVAPGVAVDDVKIEATADTVSISATRAHRPEEGLRPLRQERQDLSFTRTFQFPSFVDPERVDARLVDGVLTVNVPRRGETQPMPVKVFTSRI